MSLHIEAKPGEIAEKVLLPGDPLRAKWIAETFLKDSVLYNTVRGMLGFTGTYKGNRISIQGTGMGAPSISIYAQELIEGYGVKKLIRVGSAGSYQENLKLRSIVLAMTASSNGSINKLLFGNDSFAPAAHPDLFINAVTVAKNRHIPLHIGNVLTSDLFYEEDPLYYKKWASYGVLCVEMETAALYTLAAKFGVQALAILTISDHLVTKEKTSSEERERSFEEMVTIALEI